MIRETFLRLGEESGYAILPEVPMVRDEGDTFFIGSAVMAAIDLFESGKHEKPSQYITAQRIFSATRFEDIGKYPFATSFEVMLSIFRFGDENARPALEFILTFLKETVNVDPREVIYLAPNELGIRHSILELGVPEEQVISWEKSLPLSLGEGRPEGYYVKMFIPYRHGVVPFATLGLMELDGKIAVDSALFLERLDFVQKGLKNWYEGKHFHALVTAVGNNPILNQLSQVEQYLWANHIRSFVILMEDGATPSGKGPGHVLRKMTRQLAGTIIGQVLTVEMVQDLAHAAKECLAELGYTIDLHVSGVVETLHALINNSSTQISHELDQFTKWLQSLSTPPTMDDLDVWKSERGLQPEWTEHVAKRLGIELPTPPKETRFWFRNACYSFDETEAILDPIQFVRSSEEKRMKGVKTKA